MSLLKIYNIEQASAALSRICHSPEEIAAELNAIGVNFTTVQKTPALPPKSSQEEVLKAYAAETERIMREYNFKSVDVVSMNPELASKVPDLNAMRNKFLAEHIHTDDEVRYFVEGQGLFCIHREPNAEISQVRLSSLVYAVLCTAGDFISVPANTKHWFDMGANPNFRAIRFFSDEAGWVPVYMKPEENLSPLVPKLEEFMISAIITDIEGTTSSLSFVKDVLFPYSKAKLAEFISNQAGAEPVKTLLVKAASDKEFKSKDQSLDAIIAELKRWIDEDLKIPALKELQGLIWKYGYEQSDFKGHVYEDAYKQLQKWHSLGIKLYIYSSGSVYAQKLLFGHTEYGDLNYLFSGNFDTGVGHKREVQSYRNILAAIGAKADEVLFLSDIAEELDAAQEAGIRTVQVLRGSDGYSGHLRVRNFSLLNRK
jgi:enolase-phosphatase E1